MNVRALVARAPLETITLHSGGGALALWLAVLWTEAPKWALGPICGDSSALFGHCPLCAPAAVLTAISLAGASSLFLRRRG